MNSTVHAYTRAYVHPICSFIGRFIIPAYSTLHHSVNVERTLFLQLCGRYCCRHYTTPMAKLTTPYSPLLGPNCIRLLSIDSGASDEPLSCNLEGLDLTNLPQQYCNFSALSYRWGDDAPTFDISLNGWSIRVRENLHQFLLHARASRWYNGFWIDAVCINQDDKAEKAQQISIMGTIYSLASNVLIWLGKLSDAEIVALEEIRNAEDSMKPLRKRYRSSWKDCHPHLGWNKPWEELISPIALQGLKSLIANPYSV